MSNFIVRAAKPADESAVLALVQSEMTAHQGVDPRFQLRADAAPRYALYLHDRLRENDSSVFVAEDNGVVIGAAIGSIRIQEAFFEPRRFGYVSDLVVDPARRREGVGRALWDRVALWFRGLGVGVVRLHVAAHGGAAKAFWDSVHAEPFLVESWIDLPAVGVAEVSADVNSAGQAAGVAATPATGRGEGGKP
ncbi:MAG: hypothetical protein DHS20C21_15500 [Gemmatimonadota bacterium]|nr:MAG: hypothetical protein DHS20C21_15500 [Gemmatimonadota bacterium]